MSLVSWVIGLFGEKTSQPKLESCNSIKYVLATSINDPRSLFLDTNLCDIEDGIYICCSEQPFNSAVAYIDLSEVKDKQRYSEARKFLEELRAEVYERGSLTKRGNWNDF